MVVHKTWTCTRVCLISEVGDAVAAVAGDDSIADVGKGCSQGKSGRGRLFFSGGHALFVQEGLEGRGNQVGEDRMLPLLLFLQNRVSKSAD